MLSERVGEKLVEKGRVAVRPDRSGKPVPVQLSTVPTEVGEKTYVIDVPYVVEALSSHHADRIDVDDDFLFQIRLRSPGPQQPSRCRPVSELVEPAISDLAAGPE